MKAYKSNEAEYIANVLEGDKLYKTYRRRASDIQAESDVLRQKGYVSLFPQGEGWEELADVVIPEEDVTPEDTEKGERARAAFLADMKAAADVQKNFFVDVRARELEKVQHLQALANQERERADALELELKQLQARGNQTPRRRPRNASDASPAPAAKQARSTVRFQIHHVCAVRCALCVVRCALCALRVARCTLCVVRCTPCVVCVRQP